jgi:excisionase family DNA binding protein
LWYQIEILAALWPNMLEKLAEELHTLSQNLGDDHDLAVLRRTVVEDPGGFVEEKELLLFVTLIDQKRLTLQAASQPLGERLYFDPPKVFTNRIHSYWRAWRAEGERKQAKIIQKIIKDSPPSLHSAGGLMTTREMAARLELPIVKVRDLIHGRKLPAEKVGAIWVIKVGEPSPTASPDPNDAKEIYLSTREMAEHLGIPLHGVRKLIYAGELQAMKVGRNWVIKKSELS